MVLVEQRPHGADVVSVRRIVDGVAQPSVCEQAGVLRRDRVGMTVIGRRRAILGGGSGTVALPGRCRSRARRRRRVRGLSLGLGLRRPGVGRRSEIFGCSTVRPDPPSHQQRDGDDDRDSDYPLWRQPRLVTS